MMIAAIRRLLLPVLSMLPVLPALLLFFCLLSSGGVAAQESGASRPPAQIILDAMNAERRERNLRPLHQDGNLARMAETLLRQLSDQMRLRPNARPRPDLDRILDISRRAYNRIYVLHGYSRNSGTPMLAEMARDAEYARAMGDARISDVGIAYLSDQLARMPHGRAHLWIAMVGEPARPAHDGWREQMIALVNEFRAEHELGPLTNDPRLDRAAQFHANDMLKRDFFDHVNPNGEGAAQRAQRAGYKWQVILENIAVGQPTPHLAMTGWVGSPSHRRAMLNPEATEIGVGYIFRARDRGRIRKYHYWTILLARPRG